MYAITTNVRYRALKSSQYRGYSRKLPPQPAPPHPCIDHHHSTTHNCQFEALQLLYIVIRIVVLYFLTFPLQLLLFLFYKMPSANGFKAPKTKTPVLLLNSSPTFFCLPLLSTVLCTFFSVDDYTPFEYMVLITIIGSCMVMAAEQHLPHGDQTALSLSLEETEKVFLTIFTVEASVKILAHGFLLHQRAYLRNAWNIIDFIVVASG